MRFFVSLLLSFLLIVPSFSAGPLPQKPPEDCIICGHACCCPEVCAPKLKAMKKKKVMACHLPDSICKVTPQKQMALLASAKETADLIPRVTRARTPLECDQRGSSLLSESMKLPF